MKNPLVDALRQAQGDTHSDSSEAEQYASDGALSKEQSESETVPVLRDSIMDGSNPADEVMPEELTVSETSSNDLDLLATGRHRTLVTEEKKEASGAQDVNPSEGAESSANSVLDSASVGTHKEQSLACTRLDTEHQMRSSTGMFQAQGVELDRGKPFIHKLGRLSPVICLIALSASAAGYYRWNEVAALSLNNDLDSMAQIKSVSQANLDRANVASQLPIAGQSVFHVTDTPIAAISSEHSIVAMSTTIGRATADTADPPGAPSIGQTSGSTSTKSGQEIRTTSEEKPGFSDKAHALVKKGYDAYQARNLEQAEKHYNNALLIEPNHADALVGIAAVYSQTGRTAAALSTYEKLLSVDPSNANAISGILTIHARDSESDSESELKYLIQQYPDADPLHYALGSLFVSQARWPDAKQAFLAAHKIAPDNSNYSYSVAVSMENIGRNNAAKSFYEVALTSAGPDSKFDRSAVKARLVTLNSSIKERL